jgi:MbtH protein
MNPEDADPDDSTWLVLVNAEGQHALWPMSRPAPAGWNEVGPEGRREDCLAYIDEHWTDMRPVSLR